MFLEVLLAKNIKKVRPKNQRVILKTQIKEETGVM